MKKSILKIIGLGIFVGSLTNVVWSDDLFYFEPTANACDWKIYSPEKNISQVYFTSADCPNAKSFIWDLPSQRFVYESNATVMSLDWKTKKTKSFAVVNRDDRERQLWISAETGRVRRLYITGPASDTAVVEELTPQKKWMKLGESALNYEMTGNGIYGVLENLMEAKAGTIKHYEVQAKTTFIYSDQFMKENLPISKSLLTAAASQLKLESSDELAYLKMDSTHGLLFKTVWGDTQHAVAPVLLCSKNCEVTEPIAYESTMGDAISLSRAGDYFLITSEYYSGGPVLYTVDSTKPRFSSPSAESAIWLPIPKL